MKVKNVIIVLLIGLLFSCNTYATSNALRATGFTLIGTGMGGILVTILLLLKQQICRYKYAQYLPIINHSDPAHNGLLGFSLDNIAQKKELIEKRNRRISALGLATSFIATVSGYVCLIVSD